MPIIQIELDISQLKTGASAATKAFDDVSGSARKVQKAVKSSLSGVDASQVKAKAAEAVIPPKKSSIHK